MLCKKGSDLAERNGECAGTFEGSQYVPCTYDSIGIDAIIPIQVSSSLPSCFPCWLVLNCSPIDSVDVAVSPWSNKDKKEKIFNCQVFLFVCFSRGTSVSSSQTTEWPFIFS